MGGFVNGHWIDSITAEEAARRDAGGAATAPAPARPAGGGGSTAVPPPATMPLPAALGNTNDQTQRDILRSQGYYIDASGVYAPGAGQRMGDTFSGSMAGQNVAPSPTRLPIINGRPVSPSNGATGEQTGYIMYRSDPEYGKYFGPGTPGYTSTSQTYNATPLAAVPGQQSLAEWNTANPRPAPLPAPAAPAAPAPAVPAPNPAAATAGADLQAATAPDQAAWQAGLTAPNQSGTGFGPYATAEAPQLTPGGRYVENGQIIEKSTDQYGNPYYQTVGPAPAQTAPPPAGTPAGPATPAAPAAPATPASPAPAATVAVPLPDGSGVAQVPPEQAAALQAHFAEIARELAAARNFAQGIEQGKLDVLRLTEAGTQAYQQALIAGQNADRAQALAIAEMRNDLDKQTVELNRVTQQQNAAYQTAQLENQRAQSAQTLSLEREKLALARQQMRGRRLPQVRFA